MEYFKSFRRKSLIYAILRIIVPLLAIVACILVSFLYTNNTASFFLTLVLAVLAVSSFIFFSNRLKRNEYYLEDLIFSEALKGMYDKKKTANAGGFLNISELVRNNLFIEPYKRYGFLYYEVVYNKVIIDSSNLTLEYLEDSTKKKKRTYIGFVGRAIRYELRNHYPLYLVNKKSKYFNVGESIVEDDLFLVSGYKNRYDNLVKKGILDKLKDYIKAKGDIVLSVFYFPEAIYILIENEMVSINPRYLQKIDDAYLDSLKTKFKMPRELADILQISK